MAVGKPSAGGLVWMKNEQLFICADRGRWAVKRELLTAPAAQKGLLMPLIPSSSLLFSLTLNMP